MIITTEILVLKMVSGEMRQKQEYNKEAKKFLPVEGEEKFFEYILVTDDLVGEKVIFENCKQDYSKLEGKKVKAKVSFEYDNFNNKMRNLKLVELVPADKA